MACRGKEARGGGQSKAQHSPARRAEIYSGVRGGNLQRSGRKEQRKRRRTHRTCRRRATNRKS